jgi:peptide/nickel transport system substrate-binding protein
LRRPLLVFVGALVCGVVAVAPAAGVPEQTPKRGGTIAVFRPSFTEPGCLNPFACSIAVPLRGAGDPILVQVLEGAFELGPDFVWREDLVSGVEIAKKPFRLTYHVRPEARWSDGRAVTAADFRFTYRAFSTRTLPADPTGEVRELYRRIRSFRTLDSRTFRIVLRDSLEDWHSLFGLVLPGHVLADEDLTHVWRTRIDDPTTGRAIGSGPFLVERFDRGDGVRLVRNRRYWGPHMSYLDRFVFRFLSPADRVAALRRDEFDVALLLSAAEASEVRDVPGWRVSARPTTALEHLTFQLGAGGHPALRNRLVRQALAYGIDRVEIAGRVLQEAPARLRRALDSTVYPPVDPSYRPLWSRYRYAPERARQLLEQAGCTRGADGIYACAGERLSLRVVTTTDPQRALVLELVQRQLHRAGVDVDIRFYPQQLLGQLLLNVAWDAVLFSWVTAGGEVWPDVQCGDPQNWGGFCSRLLQRDADQVDRILDPRRRAETLYAVDAKLARAVPVVPLFQQAMRAAIRTSIRGPIERGALLEFTQNSEDWWLAEPR